jgi:hypothetical protein
VTNSTFLYAPVSLKARLNPTEYADCRSFRMYGNKKSNESVIFYKSIAFLQRHNLLPVYGICPSRKI